ncbi:motility associated factor glycosyltransferase family protein [Sporosarcina sp. P7]|uniref:motility associated factor glycosyltransferase family protein n=1 Tax=Sporosarcina sp. P7 TaxID=2048244 RepID=UPI0013044017|nr:6-hydroxymethylpterin diphosphokinase MptE-like protein [Sporosarcina sp. P7]
MILIDNRNVLRMKDRELLNQMSKMDQQESSGHVIVEQAKTGIPTIKIVLDGKTQYLQSKYDPQKEAQRFAGKFADEPINYVLFVGVGTAYHIKAFIESHPDAKFAIYEPNEEVLHTYLSNFRLDRLPIRNLLKIFTGIDQDQVTVEVQQLLAQSNNVLKIITLPVYEKMYGEQVNGILEKALEAIKNKHSSLATNVAFQKRWTINSIKNFPTVLQTPNILHDIDRSAFEGKPAIIVAAGPSLNEEFENLRYIKEHGLAYIFSVGSAINALIEQGIYPDAACTYDPKATNHIVIEKIKQNEIKNIPLVFGTSVGYETLNDYPGKMLHMITNQDTVSPNYIENSSQIPVVFDAPSIAVVTFQLLSQLGCSPIILAGQNLGYQNNLRYAEGIEYEHIQNELSEDEKIKLFTTKDVHGNDIQTNESFNKMRHQLEGYINQLPAKSVINTTKAGAHIQGTLFMEMSKLIKQLSHSVINENWFEKESHYNYFYSKQQTSKMNMQKNALKKEFVESTAVLRQLYKQVKYQNKKEIEKSFSQLDYVMSKIHQNQYFIAFIQPMVRVHHEKLKEEAMAVRYERNLLAKGEKTANIFGGYLIDCQSHLQVIESYVDEMHDEINKGRE